MKGLYLDISTEVMYVGYAVDGILVDSIVRISSNDHAAYVIDHIDQLLSRHSLTIDDIKYIVVGSGPGSYTGIRIAVTTAKTLAYAKKITLYQVSSLVFMTSGYQGKRLASIDARRGYVFYTIYDQEHVHVHDQYRLLSEAIQGLEDSIHIPITKDSFNVDIKVIDFHRQRVLDIFSFEPNYTRITEAEEHAHKTRN